MPTPVPIKGVLFPTHLEAFVFTGTTTVTPATDPTKPPEPVAPVVGSGGRVCLFRSGRCHIEFAVALMDPSRADMALYRHADMVRAIVAEGLSAMGHRRNPGDHSEGNGF
jgi:hypothetical protein